MSVRIAVIGVGALGQHHARILAGMDDVELVGVVDSREEQGRLIAERLGTRHLPTLDDVLPLVDCLSIAVPTQFHRNVAQPCLEAGLPVMMEKPLAADLEDARFLIELSERHNAILQVGHVERHNPARHAAWSRIDSPRYLRCERVSPFTFRSTDIGVIHDLMIHDLDLVLDLVQSPVSQVEAFGITLMGEHEDAVQARLTFQNGCIADIVASRISPTAHRTLQAWSNSGCTTVDFTSREVQHFGLGTELRCGISPVSRAARPDVDLQSLRESVFGKLIEVETAEVSDDDALTSELAEFVQCVKHDHLPEVDGRTALAALELAEQVRESMQNHEWDGSSAGRIGPQLLRWSAGSHAA